MDLPNNLSEDELLNEKLTHYSDLTTDSNTTKILTTKYQANDSPEI